MEFYNYFGIVGYFIVAIGFFNKDDKITKKLIITACLFNSGYFLLQSLFISALVILLTALRIYVSLKKRPQWIGFVFIAITLLIPIYSPSTDYIATIPAVLGVIAVYWFQGISMRLILLTATFFWIINNYIAGAWIGFYGELFVLTMGLTRLLMMFKEK